MEYINNLTKYEKLGNKIPGNILLHICIDKYKICLACYMHVGKYRYKIDMDVLSDILDIYSELGEAMDVD